MELETEWTQVEYDQGRRKDADNLHDSQMTGIRHVFRHLGVFFASLLVKYLHNQR